MVAQLVFKEDTATKANNGVWKCVPVRDYPVIEEVVSFNYSF